MQKRLLTADKIAESLGITTARIYEAARLGLIPCVRIGRQVRFDEEAITDWIARGGSTQPTEARNSQAAIADK
jgi:excisionase family DNA binding protein